MNTMEAMVKKQHDTTLPSVMTIPRMSYGTGYQTGFLHPVPETLPEMLLHINMKILPGNRKYSFIFLLINLSVCFVTIYSFVGM